ncbi:MAG: hypothetical protein DMG39_14350 [Acidobacteria bacterium]|nr:MAG: hypothetical protein DMG39_14350 [Acidobacteriota bacterium]
MLSQGISQTDLRMSLLAIARIYIHRLRPRAQAEIDWFAHQPTLQAAITKAAMAVNSRGARALGLDAGAKTPATKDSPHDGCARRE